MRPRYAISTVTVAPASYNLIDLPTLGTLLSLSGATQNAFLTLAIAQASAAIQAAANNVFVVETRQDQFWPARDGPPWQVRNRPEIVSLARFNASPQTAGWSLIVQSVVETLGAMTLTLNQGTDFDLDVQRGELIRLDCYGRARPWSAAPLTVVYQAGYSPLPADIVGACADLVKARLYAQTRDPAVRSENVAGVYEAQYWFAAGPGADGDFPPHIEAVVDRYRVPVVG